MNIDDSIELQVDTLKITGDSTKLYENLAKAQAEFVPVPKVAEGQIGTSRKFKYADYATLMRCVRPALSKYGIALIQPLHSRESMAVTTTILAGHGASIQCSFSFNADFRKKSKDGAMTDDPQEFGRCHTYYRRYQLQGMLGIEGDKDADDLPDVNEERAQYTEAEKPAKAPKASASAAQKAPASAESKINASALPSEVTTKEEPKAEPKAEPVVVPPPNSGMAKPNTVSPIVTDLKTANILLEQDMKKLDWKMADMKLFYKEHVDKAGYDKAANMTIDQKRALHLKLVELKGCDPF